MTLRAEWLECPFFEWAVASTDAFSAKHATLTKFLRDTIEATHEEVTKEMAEQDVPMDDESRWQFEWQMEGEVGGRVNEALQPMMQQLTSVFAKLSIGARNYTGKAPARASHGQGVLLLV